MLRRWLYVIWLLLGVFVISACRDVAPTPPSGEVTTSYPVDSGEASVTLVPLSPYPVGTATAVSTPATHSSPAPVGDNQQFLPLLTNPQPTQTAVPTATPVPIPPTPTPIPTIDVAALTAQLQASGLQFVPVKIGFHVGVGGNSRYLDEWMTQLDAAGIPFFLKSVDNAQPILFAQELMKKSGVPHVLVFRKTSNEISYDVPDYNLPPEEAARQHWQIHMAAFPPELDPSLVWLETINEVDKTRAEWLGAFALETAQLALRDGFKWAAFGWSSGEPEPEHWQTPSMLAFLRLAGQYPDRLAVALHEYSFVQDNIADGYPFKIGRFLELFRICDQYGIPRPTVLITEWGWTYQTVPAPQQAIEDIAWAAGLYAPYPQVKGAAIWYLGNGFGGIADQAQKLIRPLTQFTLTHYYTAPLPPAQAPTDPTQFLP
ncbi:MAG: hypothetical protein D6706_05435 [Chloroflexi bacterium]|nr:MAG: hypothetical protein D6706_05435 [Chloroflexota bacterium]